MRRLVPVLSGLSVLFAFSGARAAVLNEFNITYSASQCSHDGLTVVNGGQLINNSGGTQTIFCPIPVDHRWIAGSPANQGAIVSAEVVKTGNVSCTLRRSSPSGGNVVFSSTGTGPHSGYDTINFGTNYYLEGNSMVFQCTVGNGATVQSYIVDTIFNNMN